jgi:hypothetical protein
MSISLRFDCPPQLAPSAYFLGRPGAINLAKSPPRITIVRSDRLSDIAPSRRSSYLPAVHAFSSDYINIV